MSMNLVFEVGTSGHYVDFPFQTPTQLTYAILALKTNAERLKVIKTQLEAWSWNESEINRIMLEISDMMEESNLKLSYI